MKKLLVVILALAAALALTACGGTKNAGETYTDSIPVGDGVADIDITGEAYGDEYTLVDPLAGEDSGETYASVKTYYCENCDTPYIEVFSIDKGDMTLEDYTKLDAEAYGDGYYQMLDGFGYYTCSWEDDEGFYYVSCICYEGEKQFHTVCFSARTEELHIADNVYMWIPTGYSEYEKAADRNPIFACYYEESYALPYFLITKNEKDYESAVNYYAFNGDSGVTEEQYNAWAENWTDEDNAEFFEAMGFKIVATEAEETDAGTVYGLILDNQRIKSSFTGIAYVTIGDSSYRINLWCQDDMPAYPYLSVAISSIHTK